MSESTSVELWEHLPGRCWSFVAEIPNSRRELAREDPECLLVGLLHGHWPIPQPIRQSRSTLMNVDIGMSSGIGVVIRSQDIVTLLEWHPDLIARRNAIIERWEHERRAADL